MPILSHLHPLFSTEDCQAYIHTLRWNERPLQCPRCDSHHVSPWGTYHDRPGCKRYWCHSCNAEQCQAYIRMCSELILSAARLDYIADYDLDYVRIEASLG